MKYLTIIGFLFLSLPAFASDYAVHIYLDNAKDNTNFTHIRCGTGGTRRPYCKEIQSFNQTFEVIVTSWNPALGNPEKPIYKFSGISWNSPENIFTCEVISISQSGSKTRVYFKDFRNEKNPDNLDNGQFICRYEWHGTQR